MSFDPKSYELAEHFLPEKAAKRVKNDLAQAIQTAVEDFLTAYDSDDDIPTD